MQFFGSIGTCDKSTGVYLVLLPCVGGWLEGEKQLFGDDKISKYCCHFCFHFCLNFLQKLRGLNVATYEEKGNGVSELEL